MGKLRKYANVYSDGGFIESVRNFRKGARKWSESIRESVRQAKNGNRVQSTEPKFVVSQYPESPNNAGVERGPYSPIKHKSDDLLRANAKVTYVNNTKRNWNAPVKKGIPQCSQFVRAKYDAATKGEAYKAGFYADAWQLPKKIVRHGGEMLYNAYDDQFFAGMSNEKDLIDRSKKYFDNKSNRIDTSKLQEGDVVGMYMPSSNMHGVAFRKGTTKNTHVGIVTGKDKDGMPIISHNIHGHYLADRADKLHGSLWSSPQISVAVRPRKVDLNHYKGEYVDKDSDLEVYDKGFPVRESRFQEYLNSLRSSKAVINRAYPNVDGDFVEKAAIGTMKRETDFMRNIEAEVSPIKYAIKDWLRERKGRTPETKSSKLTKTKFNSLTPLEREFADIHSPDDLENPTKAGRAVSLVLARNYDYFKSLQKAYPDLGITDEDVEDATILSYNQGMHKLRTLGFDDNGNAKKSELEALRLLRHGKVKDVNSSNWKYVPGGKFIYDNFAGEEKDSYIASARKAMDNIRKKDPANDRKYFDAHESLRSWREQSQSGSRSDANDSLADLLRIPHAGPVQQ